MEEQKCGDVSTLDACRVKNVCVCVGGCLSFAIERGVTCPHKHISHAHKPFTGKSLMSAPNEALAPVKVRVICWFVRTCEYAWVFVRQKCVNGVNTCMKQSMRCVN
jgi:hypothetical protein